MTTAALQGLFEHTMMVMLSLAGPILGATLIVGLLISVLQAATQVNEPTLTFVPKLLIAALLFAVAGPWMIEQLLSFTRSIFALVGQAGP